jgi:hypothetical protein
VLVHGLRQDGSLGDEVKEDRETREGIIRETEIGILMDADVAKSLVTWLQEKIDQIESIKNKIEQAKTDPAASITESVN